MARKAKKTSATKIRTASKKARKAAPAKKKVARKPASKKPTRQAIRRSSAEVAKLHKAVMKGLRAGMSAALVAAELGISRPYLYVLKRRGG